MNVTTSQRRVLAEMRDLNDGSVGSATRRTLIALVDKGLVVIDQKTGHASLTAAGREIVAGGAR